MENTFTVFVDALNEQWEMPDDLALSWTEYEKEHPLAPDNANADSLHQQWFNGLSPEQQAKINRKKPEE